MNNNIDKAGSLKIKFDYGIITVQDLFNLTTNGEISEEDFHIITGYNYQGIKKSRGWN